MNRAQRRASTPSNLVASTLARRHRMKQVRDSIMLQIRMFRQLLATADGTEEHWGELAGIINVFGVYTHHHKLPEFKIICAGADALRAIEARHKRVGGRWVAIEPELDALTAALNAIDDDLMPTMPMVEFVRIATAINEAAARDRAAA